MMRNGRADLYFESVSPGHPATQEVSLTVPLRFLDLPERSLKALGQNGLKVHPLPPSFKGQNGPTKAADFGTNLIVHKDMPDATAYAITKAVIENRDAIVAENKAMQGFIAKDAWRPENVGIPCTRGRSATTASAAGCDLARRPVAEREVSARVGVPAVSALPAR